MNASSIFFLIIIILFWGCKYGVVKKTTGIDSQKEDSLFTKNILSKSENGYWLVVRGYKLTDHMVATATLTDYSHAAILDINSKSVIEADGSGIHESSIEKFVNHSYRITLVKPAGYSNIRGDLAVKSARDLLGKSYDFLGTVGINASEKYYCSELVVCCYSNIKDSLKLPVVIKPAYLLELGTTVFETPERKNK